MPKSRRRILGTLKTTEHFHQIFPNPTLRQEGCSRSVLPFCRTGLDDLDMEYLSRFKNFLFIHSKQYNKIWVTMYINLLPLINVAPSKNPQL